VHVEFILQRILQGTPTALYSAGGVGFWIPARRSRKSAFPGLG